MTETQQFFVRRRGRVEGPWSLEKLAAEVSLRKLGRHHELSTDKVDWFRASQVEELFPIVEAKRTPRVVDAKIGSASTEEDEYELEPDETLVWYYYSGDEQCGPVPGTELAYMLEHGQLLGNDLVWREGLDDWLSVEQIPELAWQLKSHEQFDPIDVSDANRSRKVDLETDGYATTSFNLAIVFLLLGFFPFIGILSAIPITIGILSLRRISRSAGSLGGKGLAIAAISIGAVTIPISIVTGIWFVVASLG